MLLASSCRHAGRGRHVHVRPDNRAAAAACPSRVQAAHPGPSRLALLPTSIGNLSRLTLLLLRGCGALTALPDSLGRLSSLQELRLLRCHALASLPDSATSLAALSHLTIDGANALTHMPHALGALTCLRELFMGNAHLMPRLPDSIGQLCQLTSLVVACHSVAFTTLPDSVSALSGLRHLRIECAQLLALPAGLGRLPALRELLLGYCLSLQVKGLGGWGWLGMVWGS